jgi:hypothetical protein
MKIFFLFLGISIIFLSGCSIIGLGIGIAAQENDKFETVYHIELLKEIDPGTKIIVTLKNGETVHGSLIYFEEFYRGGYIQEENTDSVYQKGYWELSMKVGSSDELFNVSEIQKVDKFYSKGNYAVPIGLGIGIAVDVLLYFLYINNPIDLQ